MSTFTETLHPRGQAANAGQFRAKTNDAPAGILAAPLHERLDAVRDGYADQLAEVSDAESALWFAQALEQYGGEAPRASTSTSSWTGPPAATRCSGRTA